MTALISRSMASAPTNIRKKIWNDALREKGGFKPPFFDSPSHR